MVVFKKFAYEERYRAYEFKRDDGNDGLAEGETIVSHTVACAEKETGTDCTSAMISNTSVVDGTQVSYMLKAGTAGTIYLVTVTAVTSLGQALQGQVEIAVI